MLSHSDNYSLMKYNGLYIYLHYLLATCLLTFSNIMLMTLECINHAGTPQGAALEALGKKERRYCPDDATSLFIRYL